MIIIIVPKSKCHICENCLQLQWMKEQPKLFYAEYLTFLGLPYNSKEILFFLFLRYER